MGREELELYMERQHGLYQRVHGVKARRRFIDKVVEATGYDRKRAIRLLNRKGEVFRQRGATRKLKAADVDFCVSCGRWPITRTHGISTSCCPAF